MFLKGKTAIVTGSTSGIGLAYAKALAAEGASVMINGFGDADEIEAELRTPRPPAGSGGRELQTRDLPKRVLYLLLADTLATDQPYELSIAGVTNINGVPDGGGTAEVLREASRRE